ncbi:fatty acid desaturase [Erythrobacter sp.]|uniref:fatty acid desaturase n=1 Tax=Erythrobacter sp. TaxID=1042 RepID=UPI002ECEAC89|nr:fatty acid desaturase [Erythrobacter sp.]
MSTISKVLPIKPDADDIALSRSDPALGRPDPRKLARSLNAYTQPSVARSLIELAITFIPFAAIFAGILWAVYAGYYLALAGVPLASLFLLRLFIIQHDCSHGSFLPGRSGNARVGRMLGVLTLTPFTYWRRTHALHHASTGNLDARGFGDVDTLTIDEFTSLPRWRRLGYRIYRHPAVLLGVAPAYLFLLQHRYPMGLAREGWRYWASTLTTTVVAIAMLGGLAWATSPMALALVYFPTLILAASIGVWLFYVQHQFEGAHWKTKPDWEFHEAAMAGSTCLDLPPFMRWFTGNIGIHHIHHLASRIPFYRLSEALNAHPELKHFNRMTVTDAMASLRLALWDDRSGRLVSFREARHAA